MQTFLIDKDAICMIGEIHFLKLFDELTKSAEAALYIYIHNHIFCSIATFNDFHLPLW